MLDQAPSASDLQDGQETAGRDLVVTDGDLSVTAEVSLQRSDPGLVGEDEGTAPAPVTSALPSLLLPGPLQPGLAVGLQVLTDGLTAPDGGEPGRLGEGGDAGPRQDGAAASACVPAGGQPSGLAP